MTTNMFDLSMYMMLGRNMTADESQILSDHIGDDIIKENELLAMFSHLHDLGRAGADLEKNSDARFYDLCVAIYEYGLQRRVCNQKEIDDARTAGYFEFLVAGYSVLSKQQGNSCECGGNLVDYIVWRDGDAYFKRFLTCESCEQDIYSLLDPEGTGGIII